jgi:hypothetical protein
VFATATATMKLNIENKGSIPYWVNGSKFLSVEEGVEGQAKNQVSKF